MGIWMLGMYMQQVIEDQGLEKALDFYNKLGYAFGQGTIETLQGKYGEQTPTPEQLKDTLSESMNNFGQDYEIEVTSDSVDIKVFKCPFYEGWAMAGMDNDTITRFCKRGGEGSRAAMKDTYPKLEPYADPRSHAGGVCLEGYKIKK